MVLSAKTFAFLLARGLAALLLMLTAASVITFLATLGGAKSMGIGFRALMLEPIAQASLMFLLAGVLWRNADRVLKPAADHLDSPPFGIRGLLRPTLFGIALFIALSYFGEVLNLGLADLFPVSYPIPRVTAPAMPSYGEIIVFVLAVISLPLLAGVSKTKVARVLAYPRLEEADGDPPQP